MFNKQRIKGLEDSIKGIEEDFRRRERELEAKIKGLALIMGYEPVSLFTGRYDKGEWEPFEWQKVKRRRS